MHEKRPNPECFLNLRSTVYLHSDPKSCEGILSHLINNNCFQDGFVQLQLKPNTPIEISLQLQDQNV